MGKENTMEQWKDIKGYEGLYQVSNYGRVKSLTYRKCVHGIRTISNANIVLSPFDNGNGYLTISLTRNQKRKNFYVHRLVAENFINNPNKFNVVNHKDFNRKNNKVENLEWCTQKYNTNHARPRFKRQHNSKTQTGERYITRRKNRDLYRVCIKRAGVDKSFKYLDEAIAYRNEVLNEINYTI